MNKLSTLAHCAGQVVVLLAVTLSFFVSTAQASNTHFKARLTLQLCANFSKDDMQLEFEYRLPTGDRSYPLQLAASSINARSNSATVELLLPRHHGTQQMQISAYCKNEMGRSLPSNTVALSNCSYLATLDSDFDGIPDDQEDTNCDNYFSPGDRSNVSNVDTDGDGVRDLVEILHGTDPTNPGSSPRLTVFSDGPFDPDSDGYSNPTVWRPSNGTWYIQGLRGVNTAIQWGLPGDIPIFYRSELFPSSMGVIRNVNNVLYWYLYGPGFKRFDGVHEAAFPFGIFGDNIVHGAYERPGITNPAVARLYNGSWCFYILNSTWTIRQTCWGGNGDIPKPADYDGDGLLDIAVFRPSEQKTYVIRSSDQVVQILTFGSGTADHTVRGDYTGDGVEDISFWEPVNGTFFSMTSNNGFNDKRARRKETAFYQELQLGLYQVHVPLNWNRQAGVLQYTVVDHAAGLRYWFPSNDRNAPLQIIQWGWPGDAQG